MPPLPVYILLMAVTALTGAGFSFVLAFLTLAMERQGFAGWQIGLAHSLGIGAIVLVAHWVAGAIRRLGPARGIGASVAVIAAGLFLHEAAAPVFSAMLAARVMMGIATAALFAALESWINAITPDRLRGRVLSVYCAVLLMGFTAGSALLQWVPASGPAPYGVTALLFAAALPLVWLARGVRAPLPVEEHFRLRDVFRLAPAVMVTAAVFGFAETVMLSLLPLLGLRAGLGEGQAALLLTALLAGGVVMQPLIGWLADRADRYRLLAAQLVLALAGAALLPVMLGLPPGARTLALAVWGAGVLSMYAVMLAIIGAAFKDKSLAHAATAVITMYGVGSAIGPVSAGAALDLWGGAGFRWLLAAVFAGALAVVFRAILSHNRRPMIRMEDS